MGLFNMDSGFARFMNRAIDVLELNILWIIFSLPIFTIGASTCAAYYVTLKMVDEEEGYVGKMFVKAFKDNFKQGTILWLITAPCIYSCYLIWQLVAKADDVNFVVIAGAIIFIARVLPQRAAHERLVLAAEAVVGKLRRQALVRRDGCVRKRPLLR